MEQTFIVAGGSRGIGAEITAGLLEAGHHVICISRTQPEIEAARLQWIRHDFNSEEPLSGLPETCHGLVYCPGSIQLRSFRSLKPADFQKDLDINLLGAVKMLQAAMPSLKNAGHASVVLFSTVAVAQGMPFHSSIAAAKAAVEGLGISLAAEWAPHIRVNVVAPSLVNTPLAAGLLSTPEKAEASAKRHPLQRIGTPADMAAAALFLLSDASSWMTGQVMNIDGGLSVLRT